MTAIDVRVLGELEVWRAGCKVALPASKKTRALLAYLVVTASPHLRERLCDLLCQGPDDPRGALRWSLTKLRAILDGGRIRADRDRVAYDPAGAECDLTRVRRRPCGDPGSTRWGSAFASIATTHVDAACPIARTERHRDGSRRCLDNRFKG